jgi:Mu-like prophage I protein
MKPLILLIDDTESSGIARLVALANEAPEQVGIVGLDNEFSLGADGWVKIAPYGDSIKERTVRKGLSLKQETFVQRLDKAAAEAMVQKFNSAWSKLKRFVVGVPIFKRHPDLSTVTPGVVSEALANDKTEYGQFADLQAREDGFYGKPVITAAGRVAIENEGLKFLSPFWWAQAVGKTQNGFPIVSPIELISAGLTDRPNIPGGEALANERRAMQHKQMKDKLIKLLGFFGIALANEATDEQIDGAIKQAEAAAGKVTALENEKTTLTRSKTDAETALTNERTAHANTKSGLESQLTEVRTALANERKERITLILDNAVREGRITIAQRPQWATDLEKDFAGKSVALANEKPKLNTQSRTNGLGTRSSQAHTPEVQDQCIALANERMATAKCSWNEAWKWAQGQKPDLFERLNEPAQNS